MKTTFNTHKTKLKTAALMAAFCTVSDPALASDFNFVQVNAIQASYGDIPGFDLRGLEYRAGVGWDQIFTEIRYRNVEDTSGERKLEDERWNISLGYLFPVSTNISVDVRVNHGSIRLKGSSPTEYFISKPKYEGLSSYVYYAISSNARLYGGLEWQNLPENADQKAYHLGASYAFELLSVGVEYTKYSDTDAISVYTRYRF